MKLMRAEWRKLLSSKILLGLLVVLIVSNFALVLYTSKCPDIERVEREVYTDYLEDPTPYNEYYAELKDILYAAFRDEPNLPYTYSGDENYNDYMVLSRIYERDAYFDGFEANIKKIIKQTENRIEDLHNYGYSDKTYTTGSQIALKHSRCCLYRHLRRG